MCMSEGAHFPDLLNINNKFRHLHSDYGLVDLHISTNILVFLNMRQEHCLFFP
jgi:glutaredoxin-related protein